MTEKQAQPEHSNQQKMAQTTQTGTRLDGRLCRIVNVANGALLDIETGNNINHIVGSPAGTAAIKIWRIAALGPGYAIRTAEDVVIPRYLAPVDEGTSVGKHVTLSVFPVAWQLYAKTDEFRTGGEELLPDVIEEWTCAIRWPFYNKEVRVLDLEEHGRGTKVHIQPFRQPLRERCQHWKIQYIDEAPIYTPVPYTPSVALTNSPTNLGPGISKIGLESGVKYILHNLESSTVLDKAGGADHTKVIGWECHGADNQKWEVVDTGVGWTLRNMKNRRYLTVNQEPENGTKVVTTVSDQAFWDIERKEFEEGLGERVYRLSLKGTNYSITLADFGSSKNGTDVKLWNSWCGKCQLWRFDKVE